MQYHDSYTCLIFKMTEGIVYNLSERGFVLEKLITLSLIYLFSQISLNKSFFAKSIKKFPVPLGPFK